MKQTVIQFLAALLGAFILIWGEYKNYVDKHPEIISTEDLTKHKLQPILYYNYQVAYDPNSNKIWYYYSDGNWYDKPPQIRKYQDQSQKALGTSNGTQGTQGYGYGSPTQASTYTQRP